jgi:hypothetical protein
MLAAMWWEREKLMAQLEASSGLPYPQQKKISLMPRFFS